VKVANRIKSIIAKERRTRRAIRVAASRGLDKKKPRRLRKAEARVRREIIRSEGRLTRKLRRANWAAASKLMMWEPSHVIPVVSKQQYDEEAAAQRELDRDMKKSGVVSTTKDIALRMMAAIIGGNQKKIAVRRHQAR
jgi:hypothetical protein